LTLSKVKVKEENVAKVVGATSSEDFNFSLVDGSTNVFLNELYAGYSRRACVAQLEADRLISRRC